MNKSIYIHAFLIIFFKEIKAQYNLDFQKNI